MVFECFCHRNVMFLDFCGHRNLMVCGHFNGFSMVFGYFGHRNLMDS